MKNLNKKDLKKELLLVVASLFVVYGAKLLPDKIEGSFVELGVAIGLIFLGAAVYIGRGYYKKTGVGRKDRKN